MTNWRSSIFGSIIGSAMIGFVVFILLLSFAPDAVPFSSNNYGWNGLHGLSSKYSIQPISSFSVALPTGKSVLLVIAPTINFSHTQVSEASNFVTKGGTLVVADRTGIANSLLLGMGVSISIEGNIITDSMYNWKSPDLPLAVPPLGESKDFGFVSNVTSLALDTPSGLNVTSPAADSVALSSSKSVAYRASGTTLSKGQAEGSGPFTLVAAEKVGSGQVIVIGDSTLFTNSVWASADNQQMIKNLLSNSTVYLDTSHWPQNVGESFKANLLSLYSQLGSAEYRYLFTLSIALFSIAVVPVFSKALETDDTKQGLTFEKSESRYNEKILDRIRKDRENYGVE